MQLLETGWGQDCSLPRAEVQQGRWELHGKRAAAPTLNPPTETSTGHRAATTQQVTSAERPHTPCRRERDCPIWGWVGGDQKERALSLVVAFSAVFPSKPFIHLTALVSLVSQEEVALTDTPTRFLPVFLESWRIRKHLYRPDTEIFPSIFQSKYEPEMKTDLPYRKLSPWRTAGTFLHSCFPPSTVAKLTPDKYLVLFQK